MNPSFTKVCKICGREYPAAIEFCEADQSLLFFRSEETDQFLGKIIDNRYRVDELIGRGGFGSIYKAFQFSMDRLVALKILTADVSKDPTMEARFLREAKSIARLTSPHTITVYDSGRSETGFLYIAMELLYGVSLARFISERPLPLKIVLDIAVQVCDSLAEAHENGIVHRDLKPENIFMLQRKSQPYLVKVLDFGIAKVLSGDSGEVEKLTRTGLAFGTPTYMSPEQSLGNRGTDHRTDIYSLGIILYEMITGYPPFTGDAPMEVLLKQINELPVPIRQIYPNLSLPASLDELILQCLDKDPARRPQTIGELQTRLQDCRQALGEFPAKSPQSYQGSFQPATESFGQPQSHSAPPLPRKKSAWKWRIVLILAGLGLIAFSVVIGWKHIISLLSADESNEAIVLYNEGKKFLQAGQTLPAVQKFEAALQKYPDFSLAHIQLSSIALKKEAYEEAETYLNKAIEILNRKQKTFLPGKTWLMEMALVYNDLGSAELGRAIASFRSANETEADSHFNKAQLIFKKALSYDPSQPAAKENLARFSSPQFKLKQIAIQGAEEYHQGEKLNKAGKVKEAVLQYLQAIHKNKYLAEAQYSLGLIFLKQGQLKKAKNHLSIAVKAFSINQETIITDKTWKQMIALSFNFLGEVYLRQSSKDQSKSKTESNFKWAIFYFKRALTYDPKCDLAKKNLSENPM